jgi:hypothetical protein
MTSVVIVNYYETIVILSTAKDLRCQRYPRQRTSTL